MIRKFCANAALVVVSLVVSVAVAEVVLRVAVSRYEYAADADYQENALRIWKRQPNIDKVRQHPDTGSRHALHHNNLALRHDRDIAAHELTERINIGVFGDSFTENVRLPAAQGFVDIADYLLNPESSGYNVLNFGVDAYGAEQEYLYYKEFSSAHRLDHVLYVLCANDLGDIVYNNLFSLDASGRLIRNPARALSRLTSLASRFHVTYLLYDAYLKFKGKDEPATERLIRRQNNAMRKAAKVRMTKPLSTLVDGSIALSDKAQSGSPGFGEARGSLPLLLAILEAWQPEVAL
ncbi:MAG: SGNH/GDSL hydrolase family protein, partial [Proteobacteria bacterium]